MLGSAFLVSWLSAWSLPAAENVGTGNSETNRGFGQTIDEFCALQEQVWTVEAQTETLLRENNILCTRIATAMPELDLKGVEEEVRTEMWKEFGHLSTERRRLLSELGPGFIASDGVPLEQASVRLATQTTQEVAGNSVQLAEADYKLTTENAEDSLVRLLCYRDQWLAWLIGPLSVFLTATVFLLDRKVALRKMFRTRLSLHRSRALRYGVAGRLLWGLLGVLTILPALGLCAANYVGAAAAPAPCRQEHADALLENSAQLRATLETARAAHKTAQAENDKLTAEYLDRWTRHVASSAQDASVVRTQLEQAQRATQDKIRALVTATLLAEKAEATTQQNLATLQSQADQRQEIGNRQVQYGRRIADAAVGLYGSFLVINLLLLGIWGTASLEDRTQSGSVCPRCLNPQGLSPAESSREKIGNSDKVLLCEECQYSLEPLYEKTLRVCFPTIGHTAAGKTTWLRSGVQPPVVNDAQIHPPITLELRADGGNRVRPGDLRMPHTGTDDDPVRIAHPAVFTYYDKERPYFNRRLLNLFDFGGRAMSPLFYGTKLQRRALRMDGFLYFIDPSYLLDPNNPGPERQMEILMNFREQLRVSQGIPAGTPIKLPVAVCIAKLDYLYADSAMVDCHNFVQQLLEIGAHDREVTLNTIQRRHNLFAHYRTALFRTWNLEGQFHTLFGDRYMFFPLTVYGFGKPGQPRQEGQAYTPFGVLEPLLWLLHMNGLPALR